MSPNQGYKLDGEAAGKRLRLGMIEAVFALAHG